jgi:tetratricopeptide (TPR) repeat protein
VKPASNESDAVDRSWTAPATTRLSTHLPRSAKRRWLVWMCVVLLGGTALGSVWLTFWARSFRSGLARVRRSMDADRFSEARAWLVQLPPPWSDQPEVAYRLGVCEHAQGNIKAALAAWARVKAPSPWAVRAGLAQARTLVGDLGRYSAAEALLETLMRDPKPFGDEVRHTLSELYFWEGRRDAVRQLLEAGYHSAADPVIELRDHFRVDNSRILMEQVRQEVDRAARLAPDDDRVWLAQVSLALVTGRFDEARSQLERCVRRRPDDPAVWRAWLEWARAVDDVAVARRAVSHLSAAMFTEEDRFALRAWLAARRGKPELERQALEQLITLTHDPWALDRLALLAWNAGGHELARKYRRRKAELDAAKDRYRFLLDGELRPELFSELAGLAESLGRRFEAQGWWTLRAKFAPEDRVADNALTRLASEPPRPRHAFNMMLGELLADIDADLGEGAGHSVLPQSDCTSPILSFSEHAEAAGLRFTFENGRSALRQIPETTAGGVALLDYDGDGWIDVYVVQGGPFPPDPARPNTGDRLFRNRGDGTFEDASDRSGISRMKRGFGHGVTVGDMDNDGHPDLFVTRWRSYALYHNQGDGTFADITESAGLGGDRDWPTSAAFADLDNDGDLDLYVCHYLVWDSRHPTLCPRKTFASSSELVEPGQKYNYCTPRPFAAQQDHLFRNDGGRFVDVTASAGIVDPNGRGLGVVAADVDGDGRIDLFVANDTTANYLWHNLGGMKFEEIGVPSGVACNAEGAFQAGMGTACGDLDGDGLPDLLVTNFYGESTTFFRNLGGGVFNDQTDAIGLAAASRFLLGFGIALWDANNDGWLDLACANGHVNDDRPDYPYMMPALLMVGGSSGRLRDVTRSSGEPWTIPRVARGLATADLDNDGRLDLVILSQNTPLGYFHNQTETGPAVSFLLEGTRSNRDGIGAVVTVTAGGRQRRSWRYGGGSYQSASDPRVHFGLEQCEIEQVEVRWPSGRIDRYRQVEPGRAYRLREGGAAPQVVRRFLPH